MTRPVSGPPANRRFPRLLRGRGRFVANRAPNGVLCVAVLRSPVAHGAVTRLALDAARAIPGVVAALDAAALDAVCAGWQARHALFADAATPVERPLAGDRVRYVGEPVALIVAEDARTAQDALEAVELNISHRPALPTAASALSDGAEPLHPEAPGNVYVRLEAGTAAMEDRGEAMSLRLSLARIGAQPLETRALVADYDPVEDRLSVWQSHQHPHQMQDIYSRLLGVPEHRVRIVCEDVGGAFGVKQQLYPDEMAVVAAAKLLGRRLRLLMSRSESLTADAQSREHDLTAIAQLDASTGRVTAMTMTDYCAVGAFPHYPRTSAGESGQAIRLLAAPYAIDAVRAEAVLAFQTKPPFGHYRGVGHPVACLVTEALMDRCARQLGEDPIAFRRRHLRAPESLPASTPSGVTIDRFRMAECLDILEAELASWRAEAPRPGLLRGVGVACLLELCASGPGYYGRGEVRISVNETCTARMEPSGVVRVATANTDQGQGAEEAVARIVAGVLGLPPSAVEVMSGDTATCPYGGGAFASRGTTTGGAAAHDAATRLRRRLLTLAGALLQRAPDRLDLRDGAIVDAEDGRSCMALPDLAQTCHFRPDLFPDDQVTSLAVTGAARPRRDFQIGAAAFGAVVDVDPETGLVIARRIVATHDGGAVVNPAMARAQIVGGAIQGFGEAICEALRFDGDAQPLAASWMDYAMPRADQAPAVDVLFLPQDDDRRFSPRGVGETGASGAPAALFNAVNDALSKRGASVNALPMTSETVWRALDEAASLVCSSAGGIRKPIGADHP